MKHFTRTLIALCMAVLCAALLPAQVFAEGPEYISEVKVGIGAAATAPRATRRSISVTKRQPRKIRQSPTWP